MNRSGTYTPDMYRAYIRSLMILIAGGAPRFGERDRWLEKISGITAGYCEEGRGVSVRSLLAAYSGQWISKNQYVSRRTERLLKQAGENARKTQDLASFVELQIDIWKTDPEHFDERRIDMARDFVARLRRYDAERSRSRIPKSDAGTAAATPASAAASST